VFTLMNLVLTPRLRAMVQLAKDPMKAYYQRELSRVCKVSIGGTDQILRRLVEMGFVAQEKRGRMHFYRLNLKNSVARQFKILLNVERLRSIVTDFWGAFHAEAACKGVGKMIETMVDFDADRSIIGKGNEIGRLYIEAIMRLLTL